jgi:hypothetical protein
VAIMAAIMGQGQDMDRIMAVTMDQDLGQDRDMDQIMVAITDQDTDQITVAITGQTTDTGTIPIMDSTLDVQNGDRLSMNAGAGKMANVGALATMNGSSAKILIMEPGTTT